MILTRTSLVLGLLAAFGLAGAVFVTVGKNPENVSAPGKGQPLSAQMGDFVKKATTIHLDASDTKTTLQKDSNGWAVVEKNGYPADAKKVGALLAGLTAAKKVAPKSSESTRFSNMGLGAAATVLTLDDKDGHAMVSLDLGAQYVDFSGTGLLTYVFMKELDRAWTVSGLSAIHANPSFWFDKSLPTISASRIKRVSVRYGDKEGVALSRTTPSAGMFDAKELAGKSINQAAVDALAFALSEVTFEDVAKEKNLDLFKVGTATFTTFDGLVLTVRFFDNDGVVWASFSTAYHPEVLEEPDAPNVFPDVPADNQKEVDDLNRRWQGWVYRLPVEKASDILKKKDALLAHPSAS